MTESQRKECHEHAWKHFALHAQQRMASVQFFVALCTVTIGGVVVSLKDGGGCGFAAVLAFSLPIFAFVFWRTDERSRELIRVAEAALKFLEGTQDGLAGGTEIPAPLRVFTAEEAATKEARSRWTLGFIPFHFSFANCFRTIFVVFAFAGIALGILAVARPSGTVAAKAEACPGGQREE